MKTDTDGGDEDILVLHGIAGREALQSVGWLIDASERALVEREVARGIADAAIELFAGMRDMAAIEWPVEPDMATLKAALGGMTALFERVNSSPHLGSLAQAAKLKSEGKDWLREISAEIK